jgi:hypothetical protein
MVLILYIATALAVLALVHRLVRPLSRAAAVVLVVLPLTIVGSAVITGRVYGPMDHMYQFVPLSGMAPQYGMSGARNASAVDIWSEFFPWRVAVRASLARGEWPLWNAANLTGHPLAAEAQSAPYSPFTMIACLLPPAVSETYTAAMALFLAALSAFLFARELGCGEGAALFAATGWGLAACVVLYSLTAMGFATVYAPLILAATRRVVWQPGVASGALLMAALTLAVLAGHPETVFLHVLVGAVYGLFEIARRRAQMLQVFATALLAGAAAFLLCAIALLPLLEAIPQSIEYRVKSEALANVPRGVPTPQVLASLATDVFPFLHVRRWDVPKLGYIGAETAAAGSIVLALAVYALWRRRGADTWFFLVLGLFCIGAGARWPPIAELLHRLPLLDITFHDRLAFHGALCLVALATLGVEHLLAHDDHRAAAITFAIVFVLLGCGTLWLRTHVVLATTTADYGRYRIAAELVFLGIATLFLASHPQAALPLLLGLVVAQRGLSEIDTFGTYLPRAAYPATAVLEPLRHVRGPFRIVGRGLALPPAMNAFYNLEDVRGYEALTLAQYVKTWKLWCRRDGIWFNRVDDLTAPFLSLMNVRFAVQADHLPVPPRWRVVARNAGVMLLENGAFIDRIFVPARVALTRASTEEVVDRMASVRDFRSMAWINTPGAASEHANGPGTITLNGRSLGGEYIFHAAMQDDGYVVISDAAWKGWQAYVDGKRAPLSRADAAFLSLLVPRGTHLVRMVYRPVSFVRGRAITLAMMALIALYAVAWRRAVVLSLRRNAAVSAAG